jgi:hypothetical protein
LPLILGLHIRLFQCPELISEASIEFFRRHQPVGCRDVYTTGLLQDKGVEAFTSNCLSLIFPRRIGNPALQTEVFVVSRDERITNYLPHSIGPYTFLSHYTGSRDFSANLVQAQGILEIYRTRAKLIITTLLHCALPAIAMGIPVVVLYPNINWEPEPIDVSDRKLDILDRFYEMAAQWAAKPLPPIGPLAPASVLPPF